MPHILDYNYTISQDKIDDVSELIRKEYLGSKELVKGNTEQFIQVLNLFNIVFRQIVVHNFT